MKKLFFVCLLLVMSALYVQQAAAQKQQHKEYADMKLSECNSCHKAEGVAPNHDSDFVRNHRTLASKAGKNCAECHTQSWCLDCHQGGGINADLSVDTFGRDYIPKSHRTDFVNLHPVKALDNPQSCYRCHDQKYCNACHARFPKGSMRIKSHLPSGSGQTFMWSSEHASEARRNLQSCQTCHPEGDVCLKCHSSRTGAKVNPHPKSFKGDNISSRTNKTCRVCH